MYVRESWNSRTIFFLCKYFLGAISDSRHIYPSDFLVRWMAIFIVIASTCTYMDFGYSRISTLYPHRREFASSTGEIFIFDLFVKFFVLPGRLYFTKETIVCFVVAVERYFTKLYIQNL